MFCYFISMDRAKYGIDAPNIIFYFGVGGGIGIAFALFLWNVSLFVSLPILLASSVFFLEALWMLYSSFWGKFSQIDRMVSQLKLEGSEKVLDVGCGKGSLLIRVAKKLCEGKAYGVDIWRKQDLSQNRIERTLENIQIEGVEKTAEVQSADMRELPFKEGFFDCVVASLAMHNIETKKGREKALQEIDRVLKPGGKVAILDFQKLDEFAQFFQMGYKVSLSPLQWKMFPPTRVLVAVKRG
ncbi:class I SAM-dependent methyltransferase [Simkania sp.]|uniref:class I SAM-dependent methyltransferase n=1 Tax=Simkania sp. TaxID=34094 RepID=UPI003B51FAF4